MSILLTPLMLWCGERHLPAQTDNWAFHPADMDSALCLFG